MRPLRIGTRGSKLALWQANHIRDLLAGFRSTVPEIIVVKTSGDRFPESAIGQMNVKGVFIKELEDALLDGRIDLAVHSMKDVPTVLPTGLQISALTKREDVRDCLVSRNGEVLARLRAGARVGTSSLRRQSQLRHYRRDLDVRDLRGNVDTRLRKLDAGDFDAIVLAKAGLDRLGFAERATQVMNPEVMMPAVGQGALGVETQTNDSETIAIVKNLDDAETRACVNAERALLAELQGGCQVPLGAWCRIERGQLHLDAAVLSADGVECIRGSSCGAVSDAESVGRDLGRKLLEGGADKILRVVERVARGKFS
ncbi:MAG: hydroxymethylbilane synthase [Candidatus Acidiferrales bacterium]